MKTKKPVIYQIAIDKKSFYPKGQMVQRCTIKYETVIRSEKVDLFWKPISKIEL